MKTTIAKTFLGAVALLGSSLAMAASITVTSNQASTPSAGLAPGTTFTLTIHGDGFPNTAGATLGLSINSAAVTYVSGATAGPFASGGFYLPHPSSGTPATFDLLAPSAGSPPSGSFDAMTLTFQVNAVLPPGVTPANIVLIDNQDTLAWFDADTFDPIPMTYSQAQVYVGSAAVPVPAAIWMLVSALGGLASVRRRMKS